MKTPPALTTLLLTLLGSLVLAQDAEQRLADALKARDALDKLLLAAPLPPQEAAQRRAWLVRTFPGTTAAAQIESEQPRMLWQAKQARASVAAARAFLTKYPQYGSLHGPVLYTVAQIVISKDVPEAERREAFETLLVLCRHSAWMLRLSQNYLTGLPLSPAEKYVRAKRGEETCGVYPYARQFLCPFLEAYVRTAPAADALAECERFLQRYGQESGESVRIRMARLEIKARQGETAARAELTALGDRQRQQTQELAAIQKDVIAALDAHQRDAVERLAADLNKFPAYLHEGPWWATMLRAALTKPDPSFQLRMFRRALQCLPPSNTSEDVFGILAEAELAATPEAADIAISWFLANAQDRHRDYHRCRLIPTRFLAIGRSPELQTRAAKMLVEVSQRLDMADARAEFLKRWGESSWDRNQPAAIDALRRAAEACPGSLAAAEAAWLHDFLAGKLTLAQEALPREPSCLVNEEPPAVVALPPAPVVSPDVVVNGDTIQLRSLDPQENLVARCTPAVSSGQGSAALATDGKSETFWKPTRLPGAMVVPLKQVTTVARLVLKTEERANLVVTLLDLAGKPLARYERDGRFWEQFKVASQWAPAELTLNLAPVPGVAFVQVELADPLGDSGGVREIEAYAPPYPAQAAHLLAPAAVPEGARGLAVSWTATEPEKEVTHLADTESARGFPVTRWSTPWSRPPGPVVLRTQGPFLGIEFHGTNATLALKNAGKVGWNIDGARHGEIAHPSQDASAHVLAQDLPPGRHLLILENQALPASRDQWGPDSILFAGLRVNGRSTVGVAVRVSTAPGAWSDWTPVAQSGAAIALPAELPAGAQYQVGLFFDSRAVLGAETASVQAVAVTATSEAVAAVAPPAPVAAFPEELAEVARLVSARKVVVAYPKVGTVREYEAARRIAAAARVYLVSDDIGLNLYRGLVLSVGRPLAHRYGRQLLGMKMLWNDAAYLNNATGVVGCHRGPDGQPAYLFVTGESVEAVEQAAHRLLQQMVAQPAPPEPFRLFAADTLEMVYPWQLHPEAAPPPEFTLRLGRNDRRSIQFGVAAEQKLDAIDVSCTPLTSADGRTLPVPLVRPVGFYEWVPFFGDLRLPNLLLDRPAFALPANAASGVWLTVLTAKGSRPGTYRGTVTVAAAGVRRQVPVRVTVESVTLPDFMRADTMSFAGVPYWFHEGTPPFERALRELARNEAALGVNVLTARFLIETRYASSATPRTQTTVGDATPGAAQPFSLQPKAFAPGQGLRLEFDRPVRPTQFYVTCSATAESALSLEGQPAEGQPVALGKQAVAAGAEARALRFDGRTIEAAAWTIKNDGPAPVMVTLVRALLDPEERWPILMDFKDLDRQMEICEEAYRQCGKPLPSFYAHTPSLARENATLFGEGGHFPPLVHRAFAAQFAEHLQKTGRIRRFYLKVSDEPRDIAQWTAWAKPVREAGLITWTAHSGNYPNIDVAVGTMNPWCPNYQHDLARPFWRERQNAGDKVWWYECGVPATRLTGSPIENLPFYWLTGKWRLDGAANYAAMHANDYSMPVPFRYEHGMDHRIAFLPDGTVLDTTRRELECDGIHDCSLIFLIQDEAAALRKAQDTAGAEHLEQALAAVLESVVPYKYGYANQPAVWHQARSALYDLAR